jgi:DNA-directed RNA polymerase specialized sigma24 family protein
VTNHDTDWLAQRFEEHRTRLTAVAHRMLGSASEADDAVQEAWLRLSRSDADSIENLGSWLTTVLSPAERVAFVLHDMFGVPFEEIAPLVGRKPRGEQAPARQAGRRLPRRCPQRRIRPCSPSSTPMSFSGRTRQRRRWARAGDPRGG